MRKEKRKSSYCLRRLFGSVVLVLLISMNVSGQTVLTAGNSSKEYLLASTAEVVDPAFSVSSSSAISGFRITISTGMLSSDVLSYTGSLPSGVTATAYNSSTGILAFSGSASASDWQALMRTVTFYNSNSLQCGNRTITFSAGSTPAFTNGHFYELVSPAATWTAAKTNAAGRTYLGYTGYLATITSLDENNYIRQVLNADAWIGASDSYTQINASGAAVTYANQGAAEGYWYWVTGPEAGTLFSTGNNSPVTQAGKYANWNSGEPNNSGNEHYGEIYSSGGSAGAWNDLPNNSLVYVVEYGGLSSDPLVTLSANVTLLTSIASNTVSGTSTFCYGSSPSTITGATPTGGIGSYSYTWISSTTSSSSGYATASGTSNGKNYSPASISQTTYFRRIVTSGSLTDTSAVFTIIPGVAITATASQLNVPCNGGSNGSITVSPANGTAPYSYLWSGGGTSATKTSLSAGVYTVTITDANSCTASASYTITQPTAMTLSSSQVNVYCNGGSNGSATVLASGGSSGYTYSWSGGGFTSTKSGLTVGVYTVTVTDANNCTASTSYTITQPSAISLSSSQTNVSCNGGSNGVAAVVASGGASAYTYSWSGGGTSATKSGLSAGNYTVTITDANSCTSSASFTITQPTAISNSTSQTNVSCNGGSNGVAAVVASGGVSSYTYSWSGGGTSAIKTGLSAGNYTVTITDANSCTSSASFTITQPAELSASTSQTNVSCNGGSNGVASVVASGGTSSYTYSWSGGGTSATKTGLTAGNYTVTITDANSCTSSASFIITQPAALSVSSSQTNVSCNGGSNGVASVVVSGGAGSYSYSWSSGGSSALATGLSAGVYTVTITDANTCETSANFTLTQPSALSVSESHNDNPCFGFTSADATVSVTGGTAPFSCLWNTGATTTSISALATGNYSCTVTDANGCESVVSLMVSEPDSLSSSIIYTDVTCFGADNGQAEISVSGGTSPYSYLWSNGETSDVLNNLSPLTYTVSVTDAMGCLLTKSIIINEPSELITNYTATNVTCNNENNGRIVTTVSGGVAPYSYLWSNGNNTTSDSTLSAGNYSIDITDANGCLQEVLVNISEPLPLVATLSPVNISCHGSADGSLSALVNGGTAPYQFQWDNGDTNQVVSNLLPQVYSVIVTDVQGCTYEESYSISQPDILLGTFTSVDATCYNESNGSAEVFISGGTSPYIYDWSTGSTASIDSNLSAGYYQVNITDNNGCATSVLVLVNEPLPLSATVSGTNIHCYGLNDGMVEILMNGGTAPYIYNWSNGEVTSVVNDLTAGNYSVSVTDANGCIYNDSVEIIQPDSIILSHTSTDLNCFGSNDGAAMVITSGGVMPFSFQWSNGELTAAVQNLSAMGYSVTVTDANGCENVLQITLSQPDALSLSLSSINSTCGNADGTATVLATGGTGSYTYLWSNGVRTSTATNLVAGSYTVSVTDANGCLTTDNISVSDLFAPSVSASQTDVTCYHDSNGSISISITGGTGTSSCIWNNGSTGTSLSSLSPGSYSYVVSDSVGCNSAGTITITEPDELIINAQITDVVNGQPGSIAATVSGGTAPYNYSWSTGSSSASVNGLAAGNYILTVTDFNGCITVDSFTVNVITGVEEHSYVFFTAYPNPNSGNFVVKGTKAMEVSLCNSLGQIVGNYRMDLTDNYTIDIKNMKSGIYYLRASDGSTDGRLRIVVAK